MTLKRRTRDNLWTLIAAPTIWAVHFLLCYVVAAYACAPQNVALPADRRRRGRHRRRHPRRAPRDRPLPARLCANGAAMAAAASPRRGHGGGPRAVPGVLHVLLAALSFIAVIFVALPALINVDCR